MNDHPTPGPSQDSASLVKRLAGPSSGKAGLIQDQTEINRIIAEASKGSKFYENEKKKDKDLTEKIKKILKQRDDALKAADLHQVESSVAHLLVELEAQRDLSQTIVHVDMDAFFANVELLHNPDLKGKPFGVGKGVLTTASYEARKFGVRSGMAGSSGFIAKKLCPELILLPIKPGRYAEMSEKVMDIFARYDPEMLAASCDEGYLNITQYCAEHALSADECVQEMRRTVYEETKLTVSAGIAPNKMLAKICSDKNKPNGQFHLPFDSKAIIEFMHDLPIRKIPGIGRVNERLLECIGVKTCGDVYTNRVAISLLDKQFGLRFLLQTYLGLASNVVQPYHREERKSIGAERTFHPLSNKEEILEKLDEVAEELEKDMTESGWTGRTVTLKFKLDDYKVFTRAKSFDRWITKKEELFATGKELLLPELPLKLRLIGLRLTKLKDTKVSADSGIKRYFGAMTADQKSPRKRRKIHEERDDHEVRWEGSMPGFHEDDDDPPIVIDDELLDEEQPANSATENVLNAKSMAASKPHSAANGTTASVKPSSSSKPRSKDNKQPTAPLQECPICGKMLEMDNQQLNTHVDYCLSRGAIQEAQGSKSRSQADAWKWFLDPGGHRKPKSKGR